jgi:PAS domain S-box-containing protein
METHGSDTSESLISLDSVAKTSTAALLTGIACYLAARIGGMLMMRPQMLWPLWPGCALLVAILLLCPRRAWAVLMAAGFAGFFVNDVLGFGLSVRFSGTLILADAVEILIAALGIEYLLGRAPRLNSTKSLAKYLLVAVVLAPVCGAFVSAPAFQGNYWMFWRIAVLEEGLALLTVTPAVLGIARKVLSRKREPVSEYVEAAFLFAGLFAVGYVTFVESGVSHPELLYFLVPFLLWSALRFGVTGTSISIGVVALLSIWGVIHGNGPFVGAGPVIDVLSLQLFLLVAATSFMFLAAVVEGDKQSEEALRRSEEQLRLAARAGRMFAYDWDVASDMIVRSGDVANVLGSMAKASLPRQEVLASVHPDDKATISNTVTGRTPENPDLQTRFRFVRPDGSVVWVEKTAHAFFNERGEIVRMVGMVADIGERKRAEEALADVSRKMVEVQEEERARIARELHDDINQRLSLIVVELDQLALDPPGSKEEVGRRLTEVAERLTEISAEVQSISHQLHSPKLELLGISTAMKSLCREFAARQRVEIDFRSGEIPRDVPHEVSLCLFRVLQEALHNAAKHSKVRHFEVRLDSGTNELDLTIVDRGAGFDAETAMKKGGLGLISMRERVRLVNGAIAIESKPMSGTTIHVRVPLRAEAKRAAS